MKANVVLTEVNLLSPSGRNRQPNSSCLQIHLLKSRSFFALTFCIILIYFAITLVLPPDNFNWFPITRNYSNTFILVSPSPANPYLLSSTTNFQLKIKIKAQNNSSQNETQTTNSVVNHSLIETRSTPLSKAEAEEVSDEMACHFPKMDPFSETIIHLVEDPEPVDCTEALPLLFSSTLNSTLVPSNGLSERFPGIQSCCYWNVERERKSTDDNDYRFSEDCFQLSLSNPTYLSNVSHENIVISCQILNTTRDTSTKKKKDEDSPVYIQSDVDIHIFAREKPHAEKRVKKYYNKLEASGGDLPNEDERLNVVVLGIDAVSHMNFIRAMPKSYSYLVHNLSAVGMKGFNKIGDNTFPNIAAVLTELNVTEMRKCEKKKTFDKCPFIWKKYGEHGFRTSFVEDTPWMGAFNYMKRGFKSPPTDYYFRPFAVAAEDLVATFEKLNTKLCYGPRLAFEVVLDYIRKLAFLMGHDKRYFQFIWTSSLTHDYLNIPRLGDEHLLLTLEWLNKEGYLNHTMFIVMSDHGIRWGEIRDYLQGQLEERLPFLYFVAPDWFKNRYSRAYQNLKMNQERLTTPFDLHATLSDLLNLKQIQFEQIIKREKQLAVLEKRKKLPRAISQFLPIPKSRTCEDANIEEHYCTCHDAEVVDPRHPLVNQAVNYAVFYINSLFEEYPECSYLSLETIKHAQVVRTRFTSAYQITFKTTPGGAVFEASMVKNPEGFWRISGSISRTNLYGKQSHCVNEKNLKLYCFCIDLLDLPHVNGTNS